MGYRIPIYQRRESVAGIPNYRAKAIGPNLAPLARGVQQLAGGVAGAIQNTIDKVDEAQSQIAKTRAGEARLRHEKTMDESHGLDVMERGSAAPDELKQELEAIAEELGLSPRARTRYQVVQDNELLGFRSSVNSRVVRETEVVEDAAFAAGLATNANKAATITKYHTTAHGVREFYKLVNDTSASVTARVKDRGMEFEVAEQLRKEAMYPIFSAGISSLLDEGDVETARGLLDHADGQINADDWAKLKDTIESAEEDNTIEGAATAALEASRKNTVGDGYHLVSAFAAINKDPNLDASQKKDARVSVSNQYRQLDFALREQDAPNAAILVSAMTRGRSPYKGRRGSSYKELQPEQQRFIDEKWKATLRSFKTSSAEDRRYQSDLDRIRTNQFKSLLLRGEAPNPREDPTNDFFKDMSPLAVSGLEPMFDKDKLMDAGDRRFVKRRVEAYILERGLKGDEEEAVRVLIAVEVESFVDANKGKFESKDLRTAVEKALLMRAIKKTGVVRKFGAWVDLTGFIDSPEEQALQDLEDPLKQLDPASVRLGTKIDDTEFEEVRKKIAGARGVDPKDVSDKDTLAHYKKIGAAGGLK